MRNGDLAWGLYEEGKNSEKKEKKNLSRLARPLSQQSKNSLLRECFKDFKKEK